MRSLYFADDQVVVGKGEEEMSYMIRKFNGECQRAFVPQTYNHEEGEKKQLSGSDH